MPRTRPEIERDQKVAQVLDVAARRLREGGYEALSVAAIARELGLSPNSIYWYFPTKDELFVAAVRQILAGILAAKPPGRRSLESRVIWFVERLDDAERVRNALYERARHSPPVAEFVDELQAGLRTMLGNALAGEVAEGDRELATEALLATIEGATARQLGKQERRKVVSFALARFTTP
jgi:TetR/AcrR family transcriptional repressor of mexAB-oprM operon